LDAHPGRRISSAIHSRRRRDTREQDSRYQCRQSESARS
jgi:hypothetical protein